MKMSLKGKELIKSGCILVRNMNKKVRKPFLFMKNHGIKIEKKVLEGGIEFKF